MITTYFLILGIFQLDISSFLNLNMIYNIYMIRENTIPLFKVFMSEAASENVSDILSSGYITQGPEVDKFESVLKEYFNN